VNFALIIKGLQALPKLFEYLEKLGAAIEKMNLEGDLKAIEDATNDLENAKTLKDKLAAGRKFVDVYKRL
jgi:hypothetical protein